LITINVNLLGEQADERIRLPIDQDMLVLMGIGVGGMILAMLLPLIVNLFLSSVLIARENSEAERLDSILGRSSGELQQLDKKKEQLRSLESELTYLQSLMGQGAVWPTLMEELRVITPTEMWLTSVGINGNSLTVSAVALNYRAVAYFYTNLQNSTNFADPVLGAISTNENAQKTPGALNTIAFRMTCQVKTLQGIATGTEGEATPSASPEEGSN
jgi:Tfp pilus assembly protein PilN